MKKMSIDYGIENWQILCRKDGFAKIEIGGKFDKAVSGVPMVKVSNEQTNENVIHLTPAETENDSWKCVLNIPQGGLYRIEAWIVEQKHEGMTSSSMGSCVHHVGVGDVFLIAGQSNAAGTGRGCAPDNPELGVHVLRDRLFWDIATTPLDCERTRHSPFIAFGKKIKEKTGCPVGLIPCAYGGSVISQWLKSEDGRFYNEMIDIVKKRNIAAKAILWYQGCSDAISGRCADYFECFNRFVEDCRCDLNDENLAVVTCQLNRHMDYMPDDRERDKNWAKIREAQRIAPKKIKNCFVTSTFDLALSDGIHNNAVSNIYLGERLAYLTLNKVYKIKNGFETPDIESAKMISDKVLELSFAHIKDMVYFFHSNKELPVEVRDKNGKIEITDAYESKNKIVITLARRPEKGAGVSAMAKAKVDGYLIDLETQIPVLGFYDFKIENL